MLIAAREAREQKRKAPRPEDEQATRDKLLDARLDRAREVAKTNKPDALLILYELRTLYGKDRDVRDRMEQAKKLIEELGGT